MDFFFFFVLFSFFFFFFKISRKKKKIFYKKFFFFFFYIFSKIFLLELYFFFFFELYSVFLFFSKSPTENKQTLYIQIFLFFLRFDWVREVKETKIDPFFCNERGFCRKKKSEKKKDMDFQTTKKIRLNSTFWLLGKNNTLFLFFEKEIEKTRYGFFFWGRGKMRRRKRRKKWFRLLWGCQHLTHFFFKKKKEIMRASKKKWNKTLYVLYILF